MKNKSSVITLFCFFNFKQHLQKAFFYEIKTYHRKWLFVVEKPDIQMIFKFFQNISIWVSKSAFKSTIQRSKRFVKILKNMRSRSIKVEQICEITKSAVFPSFSAPTWLFLTIL